MASHRERGALRRALTILVRLGEAEGQGVRVADLVTWLGVSQATAYRDLKCLESAGLELERYRAEDGSRRVRLVTPQRKPTLRIDAQTQRALKLLHDAVRGLEGSFVEAAISKLLRGEVTESRTASMRKTGPSAAIDVIARGLDHRRCITFHYRGEADAKEAERTVEPLHLRSVRGQLYLEAWCLDRNEVRTFKPARMTRARGLPDACKRRDVDLAARRRGSVRVWDGEPVEVHIRLRADKARFLEEWPLPAMRIESSSQGNVVIRARVAGLVEVTRWVLGWGASAEALAPAALRYPARRASFFLSCFSRIVKSGPVFLWPEHRHERPQVR